MNSRSGRETTSWPFSLGVTEWLSEELHPALESADAVVLRIPNLGLEDLEELEDLQAESGVWFDVIL
jgi:hypothetical protein